MKKKPSLEWAIYLAVILLCALALGLVACAHDQFTDTELVYKAF